MDPGNQRIFYASRHFFILKMHTTYQPEDRRTSHVHQLYIVCRLQTKDVC